MHTSLEEKRRLFEDLELLRHAITTRIRLNSKIYHPKDSKLDHQILTENKLISKATTKLQQHEVKRFISNYEKEREELIRLITDDDSFLRDLKVFQDPKFSEGDFSSFLSICEDEIARASKEPQDPCLENHDIYEMFSSNKNYKELKRKIEQLENPVNKRTHTIENRLKSKSKLEKKLLKEEKYNVLSSYSNDLKLSQIFTSAEKYGIQLDLKSLYTMWLSLPRYKSFSIDSIPKYKHYLYSITNRDVEVKIESPEYTAYLKQMESYLKQYHERANPLSYTKIEIDYEIKFEAPKLFCLACNKQFSKQTVFDSHLKGKKHINSVRRTKDILELESKVATLLKNEDNLKPQLDRTIHVTEREELLTVRERELEKYDETKSNSAVLSDTAPLQMFYGSDWRLVNQNLLENTSHDISSDDESDEKSINPLNIPLGLDGRPIPFWLYKLKGLKYEFDCEICNSKFKGRAAFLKHFKEDNHIRGLKELGVEKDFYDFKDLSKIEEVKNLLGKIKARIRNEAQFLDDSVQVEDDQGNAMSKKVYDQLYKQGLL